MKKWGSLDVVGLGSTGSRLKPELAAPLDRCHAAEGDRLSHSLQRPGVGNGGKIAERLADVLAADEAAHNFSALRFRELGHHDHFARPEGGTERFHHGATDSRAIQNNAALRSEERRVG